MPDTITFRHQEPEVVRVPKLNRLVAMAEAGGGSSIITGSGPPTDEIGDPGDFYVDIDTGDIYGPKDETTEPMWPIASQGGGAEWGSITGDITEQADLQEALDGKANLDGGNYFTGDQEIESPGYVMAEWLRTGPSSYMAAGGETITGELYLANDGEDFWLDIFGFDQAEGIVFGSGQPFSFQIGHTERMKLTTEGLAVTGYVTVADEAYGPAWNGKLEVPTKNAIYDKIQSIVATIPPAPSTVISDLAYGPAWNGVANIAPSQNAVYDIVSTKADLTALGNYLPLTGGTLTGDLTVSGDNSEIRIANSAGYKMLLRPEPGGNDTMTIWSLNAAENAFGSIAYYATTHVFGAGPGGSTERARINNTGIVVTGNVTVTDEAYGPTWDGSLQVPTKNAIYDKVQALVAGAGVADGDKGDVLVSAAGTHWVAQSSEGTFDVGSGQLNLRSGGPAGPIQGHLWASSGEFHYRGAAHYFDNADATAGAGVISPVGMQMQASWQHTFNVTGISVLQVQPAGIAVTGKATATTTIQANLSNASSSTNRNPGLLVYGGGYDYGMELGYTNTYTLRVFCSGAVNVSIGQLAPGGTLQSHFTDYAIFSPSGVAVTGNITATGSISMGGNTVATVGQLANYLPLTGGTMTSPGSIATPGNITAGSLAIQPPTAANSYMSMSPTGTGIYSIIDMKGEGGAIAKGLNILAGNNSAYFSTDNFTFRKADGTTTLMSLNSATAFITPPVTYFGMHAGAAADSALYIRNTNYYNTLFMNSYATDGSGESTDGFIQSYKTFGLVLGGKPNVIIRAGATGSTQIGVFNSLGLTLDGTLTITRTSPTPNIDLGATYSSTAGQNPKIIMYQVAPNPYGFGISGGSLDYMVPDAAGHSFYVGGIKVGAITSTGITGVGGGAMATVAMLANYLPLTGGALSGNLAINSTMSVSGKASFGNENPANNYGNVQIYSDVDPGTRPAALSVRTGGVGGGAAVPQYGIKVDAGASYNGASAMYGVWATAKQNVGGNSYALWGETVQGNSGAACEGVHGKTSYHSDFVNGGPVGVYGEAVMYAGTTNTQTSIAGKFEHKGTLGAVNVGVWASTVAGGANVRPIIAQHAGVTIFEVNPTGINLQPAYSPTPTGVRAITITEPGGNTGYQLRMGYVNNGVWCGAIDAVSGGGGTNLHIQPSGGAVLVGPQVGGPVADCGLTICSTNYYSTLSFATAYGGATMQTVGQIFGSYSLFRWDNLQFQSLSGASTYLQIGPAYNGAVVTGAIHAGPSGGADYGFHAASDVTTVYIDNQKPGVAFGYDMQYRCSRQHIFQVHSSGAPAGAPDTSTLTINAAGLQLPAGKTITIGGVPIGGGAASDTAYGPSWDAATTTAPSQNAVYDKMQTMAPLASPAFTGTPTSGGTAMLRHNGSLANYPGGAVTVSNASPSGGVNGDIWLRV